MIDARDSSIERPDHATGSHLHVPPYAVNAPSIGAATATVAIPLALRRRPGRHRAGPAAGRERPAGRRSAATAASSTAACIIRPRPSASCSSSCPARPASAIRSTTSRELIKRNGQPFDPGEKVELFQSEPGRMHESPWAWKQYGQCGKWISDWCRTWRRASTTWRSSTRWSSSRMSTARPRSCRTPASCCRASPAWGRGFRYGLGSLNRQSADLRRAARPRGFAPNGPGNWSAGFLPAEHQGTMIQPSAKNPIADLFPPDDAKFITPPSETDGRRAAARAEPRASAPAARAIRGSMPASPRTNWPPSCSSARPRCSISPTRRAGHAASCTGLDQPRSREDFGRNCLVARRLLERGVRFVQVWSGADNGFPRRNWDSHEDIAKRPRRHGHAAWTGRPPR